MNVSELTQDREDTEGELHPHAISAPNPKGEGEGNLSRSSGNS